MNKALSIQRSKLISAYGGVGTNVDTIDNISLLIRPFDEWKIYNLVKNNDKSIRRLLFKEERLCARLRAIGFSNLEQFFCLEDFSNETPVKPWKPREDEKSRMVTSTFFPRWFYCPKCRRFEPIESWRSKWQEKFSSDERFDDNVPACYNCSKKSGRGYYRSPLQQIRFVMASMETGKIADIPWSQLFEKKRSSGANPSIAWEISKKTSKSSDVKFKMSKGSADLQGLSVESNTGIHIRMAELMTKFIVIKNDDDSTTVFQPVIRNANNVYFGYNIASVYVPRKIIDSDTIEQIKYDYIECNQPIEKIVNRPNYKLTAEEIQNIIDSNFAPQAPLEYAREEDFRKDEFDFITDLNNYKDGVYKDDDNRLISEIFEWEDKPSFISNIFFQRRLNITSVQVAYSRIDKVSQAALLQNDWKIESDKLWYNPSTNQKEKNLKVKLHPTCDCNIGSVKSMPAISSYGEGFFIELNISDTLTENEKECFLHTFCHLIMKELEFSCGYPLASMSERIYFLPSDRFPGTNARNRYGFLIYSANGEAGSYGGITSLFYSGKFKKIVEQAILLAQDCPNDPICENDKCHCFACVDLPETSCEYFNHKLNRRIVQSYASVTNDSIPDNGTPDQNTTGDIRTRLQNANNNLTDDDILD